MCRTHSAAWRRLSTCGRHDRMLWCARAFTKSIRRVNVPNQVSRAKGWIAYRDEARLLVEARSGHSHRAVNAILCSVIQMPLYRKAPRFAPKKLIYLACLCQRDSKDVAEITGPRFAIPFAAR